MPKVNTVSAMWKLLNAYTLNARAEERDINHMNEWGGMSRVLNIPVFTGWRHLTTYDRETRTTRAVILDEDWEGVGYGNQVRWITYAMEHCGGQAGFFIIHAVDPDAKPRKIGAIESERIFVGQLQREGRLTYLRGQPRPL